MEASVPTCEECGHRGVVLSGMHPEDSGIVRWTLYGCGHMNTEIVLDEVSVDEPDPFPAPGTT